VPVIGVRELREHTSEVLRQVREENAEYVITHQGRPVALIMPVNPEAVEDAMVEASRANLVGGIEAYARLVSGQQQVAASRAAETGRRSRSVEPPRRERADRSRRSAEPAPERRTIDHYGPDILD
jgi:prevent-host-death family protein